MHYPALHPPVPIQTARNFKTTLYNNPVLYRSMALFMTTQTMYVRHVALPLSFSFFLDR